VGSIEELHAERRRLWNLNATLYARVQTWDAKRKKLKSLILVELHNNAKPPRPAVPVLEAMAYSDARYEAFLGGAERDIAAWADVERQLRDIDELINRDQRLIGFATAEVRQ